jgi:LysR family transcriptional regulator, hypochlorite-specific transcription factor HypT
MDTRWLQDFLTLAETRNFTRAAERRNTSQAAFSRRIQSLEAWAGTALIDRSDYPAQLTVAGEQFRLQASDIIARLMDARGELEGRPVFGRDHVRIALPYLISTSLFPAWWTEWTSEKALSCSLVHGNIHDLTTSLISDATDIMICHETAQQPVHVDTNEFERLTLGTDTLRPWAARSLTKSSRFAFPGVEGRPVPLLMYSPGVYFARLVDLIIESGPQNIFGLRLAETDMADVLLGMARAGHGVAWLTQSTIDARGNIHSNNIANNIANDNELLPLGGDGWMLPLAITAFRAKNCRNAAVLKLWTRMQTFSCTSLPMHNER